MPSRLDSQQNVVLSEVQKTSASRIMSAFVIFGLFIQIFLALSFQESEFVITYLVFLAGFGCCFGLTFFGKVELSGFLLFNLSALFIITTILFSGGKYYGNGFMIHTFTLLISAIWFSNFYWKKIFRFIIIFLFIIIIFDIYFYLSGRQGIFQQSQQFRIYTEKLNFLMAIGLAIPMIWLSFVVRMEWSSYLNQLNKRQEALLDAIPDYVIRTSGDGEVIYAHHGGSADNRDLDIYQPPDLMKIPDCMPPERDAWAAAAQKAIHRNQVTHLQYSVNLRNGEKKIFEARFVKSGDREATVFVQDVTERVEAIKAIRKTTQFYEDILMQLPIDVAVLDAYYQYIFINATAISDPELRHWIIGKTDFDYCKLKDKPLEIAENRKKLFDRAKLERQKVELNESRMLEDGRLEHIVRYVMPMFDEKGQLTHLIGYAHDVTSIRESREKLRTQNEQLKKVNKELDRFVYSASHDLRAPLSSALGLINLARLEPDPNMILQYLDMQEKSLRKLDEFILDVLAFSRSSRSEVKPIFLDLEALAKEIYADHQNAARKRSIDFSIERCGEVAFASDRYRVNIILSNLISNAIRYINQEAHKHWIKVLIHYQAHQVNIQVSDNGIGISKEYQEKIFDMFFRATESVEGSGLGLYIVKEALDKLEGTIDVDSVIGEGTTFTVTLPNMAQQLQDS